MIEKDTPISGSAIVLAAFGTREPEAIDTYRSIISQFQREFPDKEIMIAFTSDSIRRRLAANGAPVPGPLKALADLHERGKRDVVVQPLQVIPGSEFHDLASLVMGFRGIRRKNAFSRLVLAYPLLAQTADFEEVSKVVGRLAGSSGKDSLEAGHGSIPTEKEKIIARRTKQATGQPAIVMMGHGTGHPADSSYARMACILERDHGDVFLGTIDGHPSFDDILTRIRRAGVNRVILRPFLLVAGRHAIQDMAGDNPESWKSRLEDAGLEVKVFQQGLAESDEIIQIFIRHTRKAAIDQ